MKDTNDYYPTEMNEEDTACEDFTLTYHGGEAGPGELERARGSTT